MGYSPIDISRKIRIGGISVAGYVSREFAQVVRSQADIVRVISGYVSLKRSGDRFWGCCPFHHEKTPSFSVKPEEGFFYCFGCHVGGNVFKFISMAEGIKYNEAVEKIAEELGIAIPQRERTPAEIAREKERTTLLEINRLATGFFHNCLTITPYGREGLAYLHNRGINEEIIKEFSIGFAPAAWNKLATSFMARGFSAEDLQKADLIRASQREKGFYDRFRNRIMIPITDDSGKTVAFGGRILPGEEGQNQAKYLNSKEGILFNKRRMLFGWHKAKRHIEKEGFALVVEGYMDVISVYAAGIKNVVASLGTAFTIEQCKKLLAHASAIYFCYDSDRAGQNAILRGAEIASSMDGAIIKVVQLPEGKDPDEYIRKHGGEAFKRVIESAISLLDFQLETIIKGQAIGTLEGRLAAMKQILPLLSGIKNIIQQNAYISRAAQVLGVSEVELVAELRRGEKAPSLRQPQAIGSVRTPVKSFDDALSRALRLTLKYLWENPHAINDFSSKVPLASLPGEIYPGLLAQLSQLGAEGKTPDIMDFEPLGEATVTEITRALMEEWGEKLDILYADSVRALRKNYLHNQYEDHRQRSDELWRLGKSEYLQEAAIMQDIKKEMDEL